MTATMGNVEGLAEAQRSAALETAAPSAEADAPAAAALPARPAKPAKVRRPAFWRLIDWRVGLAGVLVGALVHVGLVLSAPYRPRNGGFERIKGQLPVNRIALLPVPAPGQQPLPFMVPDALYAVCRYDLSIDSLRISTSLMERGWSLSLHSAVGDNFYTIPGQVKRTDISFVVLPSAGAAELGPVPRRIGSGDMLIASPTIEGVAVVRAPLKGIAYREETAKALSLTSCSAVKR